MEKTRKTRLFICGVLLCLPAVASDAGDRPANDVVLVEVDGTNLTMADLVEKNAPALFQAQTTYYESERKAIEGLVEKYLLERQAQSEGVTVPQLLDRHVNATIAKDPSEEALRVYYEGLDTTASYDSVREKILDALRERRLAKAKAAYLQSLRSRSSIVLRLPPPRAPISMTDVPRRGPADAPITLLEFADFECTYCRQAQPVISKLETEFKGKIAFAYKDFPLTMHPDSQKAAEAAQCAGAQGKYWEYHDQLFAKQELAPAALKTYAGDLKLDTKAFDTCLDTGQMSSRVKNEYDEAVALGFQGTPTFLVNGRYVSGNATYERLRAVISEELSAAMNRAAASGTGATGQPWDHARVH